MAKTQTTAPKEQAQEVAEFPKLDVRIFPVKTDGALKANATVNIGGIFAVTNVRVMEGTKGLFVSLPSYKGRNGEFKDICFPCTRDFKAEFDKTIISAYEQTLSLSQTTTKHDGQKQEQITQPTMATM